MGDMEVAVGIGGAVPTIVSSAGRSNGLSINALAWDRRLPPTTRLDAPDRPGLERDDGRGSSPTPSSSSSSSEPTAGSVKSRLPICKRRTAMHTQQPP